MKSNIQVILPKKLVDVELLLEKEVGSLSEKENDDWLNYELNHKELKTALGMKIEGHDDEVVEETQPSHVSTLTFDQEANGSDNQPMEIEPKSDKQSPQLPVMPVNMVYLLSASYRPQEGQ
ncbi:unnamed protein product [Prunus armeniaca]|uniref:Uncharacterized protein n=1 Tax=Prunus armeniaca TaxID=36596 RepID=A0A6J5XRV0_PRUAR|nr:unnamed protein product [Prunus armeniaca]